MRTIDRHLNFESYVGGTAERDIRDAILYIFSAIADDSFFPVLDMEINGGTGAAQGHVIFGFRTDTDQGPTEVGYSLVCVGDPDKIDITCEPIGINAPSRRFLVRRDLGNVTSTIGAISSFMQKYGIR